MSNTKTKGFLIPLIAVGALAIAGLGGGGCGSDDDGTEQPTVDAGADTSKGGGAGKGGSAGSNNCGTADTCTSKDDCWAIHCTCAGGKEIDLPAECNNGCCLQLEEACKQACPAGTGGSGQGGSNQGGSSQGGASQGGASGEGGAAQGGASQGGASGEGGAAQGGASQGGASGEGGTAQGGASGEGGTAQGGASQGGASGEGGTAQGGASQGGASGEGGTAQGGASGQGGSGGTTTGGLVINEVDYDAISPPDDAGEFIELYNAGSAPVVLDGLGVILVNGSSNKAVLYGNSPFALSGTLNAGQYLLLYAPSITPPATCALSVALPSENLIQNGAPDGMMIVNMTTNEVIDTLAYEGSITATLSYNGANLNVTEGTGTTAADSNTAVGSLSRLPNGTDTNNNDADFKFTTTPTPCAANVP